MLAVSIDMEKRKRKNNHHFRKGENMLTAKKLKVDIHIKLLNKLNEPRDHLEYGFLRQANSVLQNCLFGKMSAVKHGFWRLEHQIGVQNCFSTIKF